VTVLDADVTARFIEVRDTALHRPFRARGRRTDAAREGSTKALERSLAWMAGGKAR
jgi:hypothetical protein